MNLSSVTGWLYLGNNAGGGLSLQPTISRDFALLPTYSGIDPDSKWYNYKFNQNGDVFSGDLNITGSLEVKTLVSDIEVEDAIITLNKNAPVDGFSTGIVMNTFNNTRFSGLLKVNNSSDFYLFANSATLPTPVGWFPVQTGNLYAARGFYGTNTNVLNPSQVTIRSPGGNVSCLDISCDASMTERLTIWRNSAIEVGSMDKDGLLSCLELLTPAATIGTLTLGTSAGVNDYILPNARGTDQQILKTDGVGNVSWEVNDELKSPDGLTSLTTANDNLTATVSDGVDSIEAIDITHDITNIRGGSSEFRMTDRPAGVRITRSGVIRLSMTGDDTSLFNGNNNSRFQIFEKSCQISTQDAGNVEQTRVLIDTVQSRFNSPNESQRLLLTDSTFQLSSAADNYLAGTSNTILGISGGITRFQIATTFSDLNSPSGTSRIRVLDDRVETNIRLKVLANAEVSGQHFVGDLIGTAQSNIYSTSNTRVGLCVDAPPTTTAELQLWAVNNVPLASVENTGKGVFPALSTDALDTRAANPLVIGSATATAVEIGKSGADTTVKGSLIVEEGLKLGVAPNDYTIPVIKGLEGQYLEADASGNLQFGNHEFYASLQAENNFQITLTNANQYYPPQNATVNAQSSDFIPTPPSGFQYNKANSRFVKADFHASIEQASAGSGNIINVAVLVNGAKQPGRSRAKIDNTNPYPVEVSLSTVFLVSNGDIISAAVECETNAGITIDIYSYSFVISKV
jgi:hypothetical protein